MPFPSAEGLNFESRQRTSYIKSIFERGISLDDNTIGIYSTSLEALIIAITTGKLPGRRVWKTREIAFYPRKYLWNLNERSYGAFHDDSHIFNSAVTNARRIAASHYFLSQTGINLDDKEMSDAVRDIFSNVDPLHFNGILFDHRKANMRDFKKFQRLGLNTNKILDLLLRAKERKGIILSLDATKINDYSVFPGDLGAGDMKLLSPNGFDLSLFSGGLTLGSIEQRFIEGL